MFPKFFKSNAALGHKQYVYLLEMCDGRYVILNSAGEGFYTAGHIDKFEPYEVESCSEDEVEFD